MNWIEVNIYTTTEGIEHIGGMLIMTGINGYSVEDKNDFEEFLSQTEPHWDYVDESLNRLKTAETKITFYVCDNAQGLEQLSLVKSELLRIKALDTENSFGRLEIELNNVLQQDWENGWKKYFKPFEVGKNIIIIPSWEKIPENNKRKVLTIDPGMSFGTGQHHTTKLCIEALENIVKDGDTVLDLGSGSGILSIASLILGANKAVGVDIDELAVDISKQNALLNGFKEEKYTAFRGNILSDEHLKDNIKGEYDVVVANIVADVLIAFAPVFKEYMNKNTHLICSGIIENRLEDVKSALISNGYNILLEKSESEWFLIEAVLC